MNSNRFAELDLLRFTAVIGMIIFHFFFLLDYLNIANFQLYSGSFLVLARFVQLTFLGLVGICMSISFKKHYHNRSIKTFYCRQLKRGLIVFSFGLLITLITYFSIPQEFVRFGILHLIGVGIILTTLITPYPTHSLLLAVALIYLGPLVQSTFLNHNILYPFGLHSNTINSIDYFPIIPWLAVILIGIFIGHHLYFQNKRQFKLPAPLSNTSVGLSGKWSLIIYLGHVPILAGVIKFFWT